MSNIDQMVVTLRDAFGNHERMSDASYRKLCAILDRAGDEALVAAYRAKIKFVSRLAFNRIVRRGIQP